MSKIRPVDKRFVAAMEEKLQHGRKKGYAGWDQQWIGCYFVNGPLGPMGDLMRRLREEVSELTLALDRNDLEAIRKESADVANFAMFIADIHGALDEEPPC